MKSIACAALCAAVLPLAAETTSYRLEVTDGQPLVVGEDGVRRPVVIVDPADWAMVTNHAFREIARLGKTEDGRIRLHGPRKQQIIDEKAHEKATVYEDGFVFIEKMRNRTRPVVAPKDTQAEAVRKRASYSLKYRELLDAREAAKPPRTVTVEHDAATGKDTVK